MVSRSEIDMKRIKDAYKKNYGKTLYQDILVSKHLAAYNDNKLVLDVSTAQVFCVFSSFRMTLKETMRRFCSLSAGVRTNGRSVGSTELTIQQQAQLWIIIYNLSTHIVPCALVEN